ncbi:sugar kinase [Maricaulis parjimensis]|uniref:sugar kinase n=1 Tax=Maricaulis parjimensis TaxID=144023 RepID=UPI0019392A59|nr:sugar kinase [Maricaulis parjimensis]
MSGPHIVILGEAMLELSGQSGATPLGSMFRLRQGGDTLNTAIYLSRLGHKPTYFTALGQDPYSDAMIDEWQAEGVRTDLVLRHPVRIPGLYAIETDSSGERSFQYWRGESAARDMFALPESDAAIDAASKADWLYFSGISLSILDAAGRGRLLDLMAAVRARGGQIVFDPNFRPRGWPDADEARTLFMALARQIDLVLPSLDDEDLLFGAADPQTHIDRWHEAGARHVIAKQGAKGGWVSNGETGQAFPVTPADTVVDTTGAGDSFNAGVLAALIEGASLDEAARRGGELARIVVGHHGAIMPAEAMPNA